MSLDVYLTKVMSCQIFEANITHNLTEMAEEAGIYKHLWRPDEIGIEKAKMLTEPLEKGLKRLKSKPDYYKQWNPENGWGTYESLILFVEDYLKACIENPDAKIEISR